MAKRPYKGAHWTALKHLAWRRSKGLCERCGVRLEEDGTHLHHLTYERAGAELPTDVQLICLGCHGCLHPNHTFMTVGRQRQIAALRKARPPRPKRKPAPHEPAPKDAAFDRVMELLEYRKHQRRTSGRLR